MLFHTRKRSQDLTWKPSFATSKPDTLWRVLQDYDFEITAGKRNEKDRYTGIKPYEFNMWSDPPTVPYFNASRYQLVDGLWVIAMQAPLRSSIGDFVHMAVKDKITHIVTLGRVQDGATPKIDPYWENSYLPESIRSELVSHYDGFDVRKLYFSPSPAQKDCLCVEHIHLYAWPDHLTPERLTFNQVLDRVALAIEEARCQNLVVHCSAGVGRTGTFLAALRLRLQGRASSPKDVFEAVAFLKKQRFMSVESKEQYEFLLEA